MTDIFQESPARKAEWLVEVAERMPIDTRTYFECDNCHKPEYVRFFEIQTDAGGQVCVWEGLPTDWLMMLVEHGELHVCSSGCAMALSKDRERETAEQHRKYREELKNGH